MGKENPNFDLAVERAKSIVGVVAAEIENLESNPLNELLKDKWSRVMGNTDLPIYTYSRTLFEAGIDEEHVKTILSLARNLEIDVSDPHTSSSELSVIAGILANDLVGIDLSEHRKQMDRVKLIPINVQKHLLRSAPPNVVYTNNEMLQYQGLVKLKEWQRRLIASNRNYLETSRQILERNNQALEAVTRGHLIRFWEDNEIDKSSKATVYFRDHKTYAGDIDFYYWGPEPEKCTLELSKYLMSLGYKVDHRSNILVEDLIRGGGKINNGFLAAYLYMYFYMGKAIEINGDDFAEHYARDVLPRIDLNTMWQTSHKSLTPATEVIEQVYGQNIPEYPGLKDYPFRLLTITLMGLAIKYDIPFTFSHEGLLDKLGQHLDEDKINVLKSSFYYINQARNLYQLISERRWEMITPEIKQEINRVLVVQSGDIIEEWMTKFARTIKAISTRHFGEPQSDGVMDLLEAKDQASSFVAQSYRKVGERYKRIASL